MLGQRSTLSNIAAAAVPGQSWNLWASLVMPMEGIIRANDNYAEFVLSVKTENSVATKDLGDVRLSWGQFGLFAPASPSRGQRESTQTLHFLTTRRITLGVGHGEYRDRSPSSHFWQHSSAM